MSDANDQPSVSSDEPTTPGAWLKRERERQGMTTQRVASDMHLSTVAIDAIEGNRFATLGAAVFAKGHLRKYASILRLPVDRLIELYDRLEDAPRQVDPIPLTQRAPEPALRPAIREMLATGSENKQRAIPWIPIAIVLFLIAAAAGWWFLHYRTRPGAANANETSMGGPAESKELSNESNSSAASPPKPSSVQGAIATPTQVSTVPSASVPTQNATASIAPASASRTQRSTGVPPPGKVRVRLTFARESWVEVYDAGGNRMLYDVGRADLPRMIDVEPPALVVLGDAGAVTTEANDKMIVVPPKNLSGTVARFTIAADGSVK